MADTIEPIILVGIAILAAQEGKADAVARGDAAAVALVTAGIWSPNDFEAYKALPVTDKLLAWKGEKLLAKLTKPTETQILAIKALYDSAYNQPPGFISDSWAVLKGAAVVAALNKAANAVEQGDNAANALALAAQWNTTDYGNYLKLTPEQKLAFWASGGDRSKIIDAAKPVPANPGNGNQAPAPAPAPSSGMGTSVVGGVLAIGAVWLLSTMFGGKGR